MTWTWAFLIASWTGFTAFGFVLCALLAYPELPEREEPVPRHLRCDGWPVLEGEEYEFTLRLVPPPPVLYDWAKDSA